MAEKKAENAAHDAPAPDMAKKDIAVELPEKTPRRVEPNPYTSAAASAAAKKDK